MVVRKMTRIFAQLMEMLQVNFLVLNILRVSDVHYNSACILSHHFI